MKGMSTLEVREVFDRMLKQDQYPEMKNYLIAIADFVNNPDFEPGPGLLNIGSFQYFQY
jgi:hypothetical protein